MIFWATLLSVVILLLGKAVRHCTPFTVFVVEGSKIWPWRIGMPSHGLMIGFGGASLSSRAGPSRLEKSPSRSAAVGMVLILAEPSVCRYCSQEKKENVRSWPLYTLGIQTGPPNVPQ